VKEEALAGSGTHSSDAVCASCVQEKKSQFGYRTAKVVMISDFAAFSRGGTFLPRFDQ